MTALTGDWPSAYLVPSHAYIPGQNARHAEDAFDDVKATAQDDMPLETLYQSAACAHGLAYIEHGYYWEAHEVLEQLWMVLDKAPQQRRVVQAIIQIANGLLKLKMGQPKAARRLHDIAADLLDMPSSLTSDENTMTAISEVDSFTALIPHIHAKWLTQLSDGITHYNAKN